MANTIESPPKQIGSGFHQRLPFRTKLYYGLGEVNQTITYTIISMYIIFFLTEAAGISPVTAAMMVMVVKIWDGVNNPLMGWISDRSNFKRGKRKPYILAAAFPIAIFFVLMWFPVNIENPTLKVLFYGGAYFLFATSSTMFAIPYYALGMNLTDNYNERTSIANIRATSAMLLSLVVLAMAGVVLNAYDDAPMGYFVLAIGIAVLSVIPVLLVYFKSPERNITVGNAEQADERISLVETFRSLLSSRPMVCASLMLMMNKMATGIFEGFLVFYCTYWLGRGGEVTLLLIAASVAWMLSIPVWDAVGNRMGKRFVYIAVSLVWIVGSLLYLIPGFNSSGPFPYIITCLIGFGYGYARVIPPAMVPDIADYDELKNGRRREGLIYGFWNMFGVFGAAIAMIPISMILERVGYVPNQEQTELASNTIRWLMALGPAIPLAIGIVATLAYNITKKKYAEIREELDLTRAE